MSVIPVAIVIGIIEDMIANNLSKEDNKNKIVERLEDLKDKIKNHKSINKKEIIKGFTVIDTKTGKYPDVEKIALKEDWAKGLIYCDIEGFAILEDGDLILADECGNYVDCPLGRFKKKPIYYL